MGIIASFVEQQGQLLRLIEAIRGLDLNGITITSPVVHLITYSLMVAFHGRSEAFKMPYGRNRSQSVASTLPTRGRNLPTADGTAVVATRRP